MALFGWNKEKKEIEFEIAGTPFKTEAIKSIMELNAKYKKPSGNRPVYKYKWLEGPCDLVPEPKNPTDKNAIMVVCGGTCVGYVPAEMTAQVKKMIKKYDAAISLHGGRFKEFDPEDDEWITRDSNFKGTVTMTEK